MMNETGFSERRQFVRIPSNIPVHYSPSTGKEKEVRELSFLKNVSVGGMLFESRDPMPKGNKFRFSISLDSTIVPLHGLAEVMWTREKGKVYEVGSRFLKIDRDGRDKLVSYVEYELEKLIMEQDLRSKASRLREIGRPWRRRELIPFLQGLEKNMRALRTFLEEEKGGKESSDYLSLQAKIARQTGAFIEIFKNSPLFMAGICLTNRITHILSQMGTWKNLLALTSEQKDESKLDFSDSLQLLAEIQNKI